MLLCLWGCRISVCNYDTQLQGKPPMCICPTCQAIPPQPPDPEPQIKLNPCCCRAESEEEYEWVREYNYRVNSREEGRKFWFQFQNDRVTYADLNTSLNLMKRSKLITGQSFPRPSKVPTFTLFLPTPSSFTTTIATNVPVLLAHNLPTACTVQSSLHNTCFSMLPPSRLLCIMCVLQPLKANAWLPQVIVKRRPRNEAEEDVGRKRLRDLTGTDEDFSGVGMHTAAEVDTGNGWALDPDSNP